MKFSLFRSGWGPRVGAAVFYALVAFGAVAIVTHPTATPDDAAAANEPPATGPAGLVSVRIVIESVQPVSQWTVRNAGEIIAPEIAQPTSWEAEIRCSFVELSILTAAEVGDPTNALRVRLETEARRDDFTFWCPGDCALEIKPGDFPLSETEGSAR